MPDPSGGTALFASYNIHKAVGTDGVFNPERIARVVEEIAPDVIAMQEADRRFGDKAGLLDLDRIAGEIGLVPVRVSGQRIASHGWHGNLILVREALVHDLRQVRLPGLEPRGALVVDMEVGAHPVRVMAAHLGLLRQSRLLQVQTLLSHAADGDGRPVVVMGDLNEWRRDRRSALRRFHSRFGPTSHSAKSYPSYFPMFALDRIIASPGHIMGPVSVHSSPLARVASDHLPITARLRLDVPAETAATAESSTLRADAPPLAMRRRRSRK